MNRFFDKDGVEFNIDVIKANLIKLNNADLTDALSKTDWYIVRSVDASSQKEVPQVIADQRLAVRTKCAVIENEIVAAVSVDELKQIYAKYL
jgi:hypothetical protein